MTLFLEWSRDFDDAVFAARYVGVVNDIVVLSNQISLDNLCVHRITRATLTQLFKVSSDSLQFLPACRSTTGEWGTSIHHSIDLNPIMFRTTVRTTSRFIEHASTKTLNPRITKRFSSSGHGSQQKSFWSTDAPWAISSLAITVPLVPITLLSFSELCCWLIFCIIDLLLGVYYSQVGRGSSFGTSC